MRRPVRVSSDPFDQVVVPEGCGQVETFAPDVGILVTSETSHVDRSVVDEEASAVPIEAPYADRKTVTVQHVAGFGR